jgi:hypothetical protein
MVRVIWDKSTWRRIAVIGILLGFGLALSGCDKCGNSIFRMGACKEMQPRS